MQDRILIDKINKGDPSGFKELFECHKDSVFNICYRIAGNKTDAEDITQEVFLRVYQHAAAFKHRSKLATWIFRIAVNLSLNHIRKHKRIRHFSQNRSENTVHLKNIENIPAPSADQPDQNLEKEEREQIVWRAIQSLPRNQRVVLFLQRYEELSCQQIADVLECSLSSVQSRLHRAKRNVYRKLLPYLEKI
jgi:RNA polymerase sigma-70 factor (ECF subfamily)